MVNRLPRPRSTRQQRDWLLNRLLEPGTPSVYAIPEAERRKHAPQWEALLRTLQRAPLASLTSAGTLRDSNKVLEMRYGTETFPFTDPRRATCYIASMASGSAVRSDNPFQHVREPVRGTMAVEMEGAAFYRTVADFPDVRPLLVKGVCDYADMEKDDTYHRYAAQVSATYVWCFLQAHVTAAQMPRLHTTPARRRSRRSSSAGSASPPPRGPSPEALTALETHYRQTLIDQFEHLTFKGLSPSGTPIVLPLEQIYVELKAVADVPDAADAYSAEERRQFLEAQGRGPQAQEDMAVQLDALRVERWNRQARQELSQLQRRSIHDTLMDATQRGVVILGDPGSGKTTLLHYQALRAARGPSSPGATPALLPIFVPLAAYDDSLRQTPTRRPLEEFLPAYYEQWRTMPGLAPLFEKALEAGRALVLLDGLDEVPDTATRQFVAEQAGAFIQHWAARGNRFAVTSRIVGYREARLPGDLPHVTVLDFGRAEMEVFAGQWCQAYETWVAGRPTPTALQQAEHEAQALLREVQSNPSVERLAASPLLLTMLALLRRQVGKLPERRIALYERYVSTLIDNWELVRSAGARQQAPTRFDLYTAQYYLIELALWLQQHKPSGTARRQELQDVLERICLRFEGHGPASLVPKQRAQAQRMAAQFLQDMRHFAGLLAERGRDAFGFLHLTFQEYFCGRALARLTPEARWQAMQAHLHLPRWREPILLCAGQLGVMEQRRDQADALVQRILSADSPHEDLLHRDLFLAVALATDDVGLSPAVLDAMTARLAPLRASHVPTIRDTALAGLAHLAQLGHGVALDILLTTLQDTRLQYHVMRNAQAMLGAEPCRLLRQAVVAKLDDPDTDVRRAALGALAGLVGSEAALAARFLSWLGTVSELVHGRLSAPGVSWPKRLPPYWCVTRPC